jgi:hypothetical protein
MSTSAGTDDTYVIPTLVDGEDLRDNPRKAEDIARGFGLERYQKFEGTGPDAVAKAEKWIEDHHDRIDENGRLRIDQTAGRLPDSPLVHILDQREARGDNDALLSYAHKPGGRFEGYKVTEHTIQENIDFAAPGGEYGNWSIEETDRISGAGSPGYKATPMGRFQFMPATLLETAQLAGIPLDTKMTPEIQELLFDTRLRWRVRNAETVDEAMVELRKEWEGFNNVTNAEFRPAVEEYLGHAQPLTFANLGRANVDTDPGRLAESKKWETNSPITRALLGPSKNVRRTQANVRKGAERRRSIAAFDRSRLSGSNVKGVDPIIDFDPFIESQVDENGNIQIGAAAAILFKAGGVKIAESILQSLNNMLMRNGRSTPFEPNLGKRTVESLSVSVQTVKDAIIEYGDATNENMSGLLRMFGSTSGGVEPGTVRGGV